MDHVLYIHNFSADGITVTASHNLEVLHILISL